MNRQRQAGFVMPVWGYLVLVIVAALAVYACFQWVDSHWETSAGVKKGEANVQAKWDAANRKAAADDKDFRRISAADLQRLEDGKTAADRAAAQSEANYQEERRARRLERQNRPLAVCGPVEPAGAAGSAGGTVGGGQASVGADRPAAGAGVLLTPDFVREYDGAWTGLDGQPVQRNADGDTGTAGAGTAWRSPEDVIDVAAENAKRCSADRRDLAALKARIESKRQAWDKAHQ